MSDQHDVGTVVADTSAVSLPQSGADAALTQSPGLRRPFNPAGAQACLTGLLLLIICGSCLGVDYFARSPLVAKWLMSSELREWKHKNLQHQHRMYFADFEDRLLLDELPQADFSKGGVYFIGASNVKVSIMPWLLSDNLRQRVGNYGFSASTPAQQFQFLRYLVEHKGLAVAGDKTLVVLGLFYGTAYTAEDRPNATFFEKLFGRHGLFTYTQADGIAPVPMSGLERTLRIEKVRCAGFLDALCHLGTKSSYKPTKHDPEAYRKYRIDFLGENWREGMSSQVAELGKMIAYLRARGVRVMVIYMPQATWHDSLPHPAEFRKQTESLCQACDIPIVDFSKLLADGDFYDSTHANYVGQHKLHQAMMEIVDRHLRQCEVK